MIGYFRLVEVSGYGLRMKLEINFKPRHVSSAESADQPDISEALPCDVMNMINRVSRETTDSDLFFLG